MIVTCSDYKNIDLWVMMKTYIVRYLFIFSVLNLVGSEEMHNEPLHDPSELHEQEDEKQKDDEKEKQQEEEQHERDAKAKHTQEEHRQQDPSGQVSGNHVNDFDSKIHLNDLDGPESADSIKSVDSDTPTKKSDTLAAEALNAQSSTDTLGQDFEKELEANDGSAPDKDQIAPKGKDYSAPTAAEIKEQHDFVNSLLQDNIANGALTKDQADIILKVSDSYLDKFFKKMLRRVLKRFLKNLVLTIVKSVKSAKKQNKAMSDKDLWSYSKKEYDKKLKKVAEKKKKYIQAERVKKMEQKIAQSKGVKPNS